MFHACTCQHSTGRCPFHDPPPAYTLTTTSAGTIPAGSMRVGPGTDAVVWLICPSHSAEL